MESQLNNELKDAIEDYVFNDDLISYGMALEIFDELHILHALTNKDLMALKDEARRRRDVV